MGTCRLTPFHPVTTDVVPVTVAPRLTSPTHPIRINLSWHNLDGDGESYGSRGPSGESDAGKSLVVGLQGPQKYGVPGEQRWRD